MPTRSTSSKAVIGVMRRGKTKGETIPASPTSKSKVISIKASSVKMTVSRREGSLGPDQLHHLVSTEVSPKRDSKRKADIIIPIGKIPLRESNRSLISMELREGAHAVAATRSVKTSPPQ